VIILVYRELMDTSSDEEAALVDAARAAEEADQERIDEEYHQIPSQPANNEPVGALYAAEEINHEQNNEEQLVCEEGNNNEDHSEVQSIAVSSIPEPSLIFSGMSIGCEY